MTTAAKFWDDLAEKYAAQPIANVPAFERKKAITRQHVTTRSRVLEIGCGTGSLALELAPHAGQIEALDFSGQMIRIAQGKQAKLGVQNVSFRQGTLDEHSPFERASFQCVWAYSILHLVPDRRRTLARISELLEPGGKLISSNVCLKDSWVPYGAIITVMHWLGKAPPVQTFDRATLFRELSEAGFVDVVEHDVGAEKLVAFVTATKR